MKKKLTKNVSISQKLADIDIMIAAFETVIFKNDLWFNYLYWFGQFHLTGTIGEQFSLWKSWAKSRHPRMWSSQAFIWEVTDIEYPRWFEIDKEWNEWLEENLKK